MKLRTLSKEELAEQTKKVFEKKVRLMLRHFTRNQILTIADTVIASESPQQ